MYYDLCNLLVLNLWKQVIYFIENYLFIFFWELNINIINKIKKFSMELINQFDFWKAQLYIWEYREFTTYRILNANITERKINGDRLSIASFVFLSDECEMRWWNVRFPSQAIVQLSPRVLIQRFPFMSNSNTSSRGTQGKRKLARDTSS